MGTLLEILNFLKGLKQFLDENKWLFDFLKGLFAKSALKGGLTPQELQVELQQLQQLRQP